ncbi:hypothetical protein BJ508DRAFT_312313 [Ascobolus immersus RN42]|uniref:F-box domain-containing protein n=1 Tax=Ascobolus immersus RN42 TaxID=1160509 RepID=A0A3N4HQ42_ASCIM|nr:hypothetical protein BJ508DRAFT_312313 [Ascobolus immersus RN42]
MSYRPPKRCFLHRLPAELRLQIYTECDSASLMRLWLSDSLLRDDITRHVMSYTSAFYQMAVIHNPDKIPALFGSLMAQARLASEPYPWNWYWPLKTLVAQPFAIVQGEKLQFAFFLENEHPSRCEIKGDWENATEQCTKCLNENLAKDFWGSANENGRGYAVRKQVCAGCRRMEWKTEYFDPVGPSKITSTRGRTRRNRKR